MNDKGKPIKQTPDQQYPEPKLPAASAWSAMEGMLNQQMPLSNKTTFNFIKTIKLLTIITLTASGLLYFLFYNKEDSQKKLTDSTAKSTIPLFGLESSEKTVDSTQIIDTDNKADFSDVNGAKKTIPNASISTETHAAITPDDKISEPGKGRQNVVLRTGSADIGATKVKRASEPRLTTSPNTVLRSPNRARTSKQTSQPISIDSNQAPDQSDKSKSGPSGNVLVGTRQQAERNELPENQANKANKRIKDEGNSQIITATNPNGSGTTQKNLQAPLNEANSLSFSTLKTRPFLRSSNLEYKLRGITIQAKPAIYNTKKKGISGTLLRNIHAGLLWNANTPFSGYDSYFKGTNNTSDFYKILLPGIWVGKKFNNGNEIMLNASAYSAYFGGKRAFAVVDSLQHNFVPARDSIPARDSVVNYYHSRSLAKSVGFNFGLQYNQRITGQLSMGVGAKIQWQRSALIQFSDVISDSTRIISSTHSIGSLSAKSDLPKYLNSYFVTSSVDVLYSLKKFQIGAGLTVPVTSMIASPYKGLRPLSGQVTVRWWVK